MEKSTLPKTNSKFAPEKWWTFPTLLGKIFRGHAAMLVVGALYFFPRRIGKLGISPGPPRLFQKSEQGQKQA